MGGEGSGEGKFAFCLRLAHRDLRGRDVNGDGHWPAAPLLMSFAQGGDDAVKPVARRCLE